MSKGLIVYLGGMELPNKNAAAHRIVANARIFRDLGYEVILLGVDRTPGAPATPTRCPEDQFGFECWNIAYPAGNGAMLKHLLGAGGTTDFLRSLLPRGLKAVICYNYPAVAQLRIQRLCRAHGVKHVADATEWYDASGGSLPFRVAKFTDTWLRMHVVHKRCDALITTSDQVTAYYAASQPHIVELPTLFDVDTFPQAPAAAGNGPLRLIYVGRPFEPGRVNAQRSNLKERLDLIIGSVLAVAAEGRALQLDIYGMRLDEYLGVFPEHRATLERADTPVAFHGPVANALARQLIAAADFSVFFRDINRVNTSGFPTKFSESISCGTPAITTRLPNLLRYEGLGTLFLATPGQETDTIRQVAAMPREAVQALKARCRTSAAFDYRQHAPAVQRFCQTAGF